MLSGVAGLLLVALTGRLALSWLPAGSPGSHRVARLPETWAASHVLGLIVLHALFVLASACDLRWSFASVGGLLVVVGLARWLSLPGDMVARHEPLPEPPGVLANLTLLAVVAAAVVPLFTATAELGSSRLAALEAWSAQAPWQDGALRWLAPGSRLALIVLLLHGLEQGGLGRVIRRLSVLVLLAAPITWTAQYVWSDAVQVALLFGAGCAFSVAWLRRADRRAAVLAALAFASCAAYHRAALPLGLAGLFTLVALTHQNARAFVAKAVAIAVLLNAASFAVWSIDFDWSQPLEPGGAALKTLLASATQLGDWGPFWFLVAGALVIGIGSTWRPRFAVSITLLAALLLAGALVTLQDRLGVPPFVGVRCLVEAAPAGVLLLGLAWARRPERTR